MHICVCGQCQCGGGVVPWLVPMRMALPFSLHFKTKGVNSSSILITSSSYSSYHQQRVVSDQGFGLMILEAEHIEEIGNKVKNFSPWKRSESTPQYIVHSHSRNTAAGEEGYCISSYRR